MRKPNHLNTNMTQELFSLNKTTVKICDKGSYKGENGDTLRITCKKEFSEDKEICLMLMMSRRINRWQVN